jgi:hypothetical protein
MEWNQSNEQIDIDIDIDIVLNRLMLMCSLFFLFCCVFGRWWLVFAFNHARGPKMSQSRFTTAIFYERQKTR